MSKQIERRFLQANGEVLTVELERKSVKRLNLRVREDGSVHLSIPNRLPMAEAERFLQRQLPWIKEARLRMRSRKKADFSPVEGATLPVLGVPRTLHIVKGARPRYLLGEDALTLWVSDPEDKAACNAALRRFVKAGSKAALTARVEAIYPRFSHRPATFPVLSFRWMRSRWGSCTAKKGHMPPNGNKSLF